MKKLRPLWFLAFIVCLVLGYQHFRPDPFFANIGLDVPQSAIVSHRTSGWLSDAPDHLIVLNLPASKWPRVLAQFKSTSLRKPREPALVVNPQDDLGRMVAKMRYFDMTPNLKTHYRAFVSGHEEFFPKRSAAATAGYFEVLGRAGNRYHCRFLRDETTGRVWFWGRMYPLD